MKLLALLFLSVSLAACAGYADTNLASENSDVANAAGAEIDSSNATGNKDTQCSDYVASVLRRLGYKVEAFHANDFDQVATKILPDWKMTEFTTENLETGRIALRQYLNSFPDHTAFFAQWPRVGQSGHVAIVEKIATDSYVIYQAQGGMNTPYKKVTRVESLLYGNVGVDRSKLRLWAE
jgi:surface antigen